MFTEFSNAPPEGVDKCRQKSWDTIRRASGIDAPDPRAHARLLASRAKESSAWLDVLPISYAWMTTPSESLLACVLVPLRLYADPIPVIIVELHGVDSLGTHGLSCCSSESRHHRHAAWNDIVHRRPTAVGWEAPRWHHHGTLEVWDATWSDTFAPSYTLSATSKAGLVAAGAEIKEELRRQNTPTLVPCACFHPNSHRTYRCPGAKVYEICQRTRWAHCACHRGSEVLLSTANFKAISRRTAWEGASVMSTIDHMHHHRKSTFSLRTLKHYFVMYTL